MRPNAITHWLVFALLLFLSQIAHSEVFTWRGSGTAVDLSSFWIGSDCEVCQQIASYAPPGSLIEMAAQFDTEALQSGDHIYPNSFVPDTFTVRLGALEFTPANADVHFDIWPDALQMNLVNLSPQPVPGHHIVALSMAVGYDNLPAPYDDSVFPTSVPPGYDWQIFSIDARPTGAAFTSYFNLAQAEVSVVEGLLRAPRPVSVPVFGGGILFFALAILGVVEVSRGSQEASAPG